MHNIGIVGCGYWGSKMIDRVYNNKRFNLLHVADKNFNAAKSLAHNYQCAPQTCINNIVRDDNIDMVGIFTNSATHFELCKKALEHGKHVWTTKPFVLKSSECEELIQLAIKNKKQIFLDCTYLFSPVVRAAKELMDFEPIYIEYVNANRWTGAEEPGMTVIEDLAPHIISILCYLFPSDDIEVLGITGASVASTNDMVFIRLKCGKTLINLTLGWASYDKQRMHCIVGANKMIKFGIEDDLHFCVNKSVGSKIITEKSFVGFYPGEPLQIEIDEIADALEGKKEFIVDFNMIRKVTRVVEHINNSNLVEQF